MKLPRLTLRRYAIISPGEFFLSFAGSAHEGSRTHQSLCHTNVGHSVRIVECGNWIHVETIQGVPIAALSAAGREVWRPRLGRIRSATVTAMVKRTADQQGEAYKQKTKVLQWEYPIVEVCWEAPDNLPAN